MNGTEHIIIQDRLTGVSAYVGYLCHAYCHQGACTFEFNNGTYRMTAGDCLPASPTWASCLPMTPSRLSQTLPTSLLAAASA